MDLSPQLSLPPSAENSGSSRLPFKLMEEICIPQVSVGPFEVFSGETIFPEGLVEQDS